ncbi:c-type cytochrome [Aneurinibacillus migulanus]|uniref:c-type cytochrome n=1 Tax=Aneurinibacillus migulanus TaxID=47500 RepID=UPI002100DB86|nr:cytochrome c [Aneurinibacillus migulanus]MED0891231.1 cytochrome c [Aneurinibacillus migulanus]MED1614081.1 cytochrome c [Aneurinibacillus migulanus]
MKGDGKGDAAGGGGTSTPATEEKKPEGGEADKGGASATAPTGGTAEEGKTMASSQCLSCHGQNLEGGIGPSLAGVVDRLKPEGVVEVLKNGRGGMPPLGAGWSDQQMSSMIEYLTTVK